MRNKTLLTHLVFALAISIMMASCNSDDDNKKVPVEPVPTDIGKDHTYSFTVDGGATHTGTIPNADAVSIYSTYPQADILMTTFYNGDVTFNCNYTIVDNKVLNLEDSGGNVGEASVMLISVGDGSITYLSLSGSVEISNLNFQFTTGNSSWAVYTIHFTGQFADSIDEETANIVTITGTYTIYPEAE